MSERDGVLETVAGIAVSLGFAWWGGAWAASFVFDQGWLRAGAGAAWSAATRLPEHWADPRLAWDRQFVGHLPGPVPYYLSMAGVVVACVWWWGVARWVVRAAAGQERRKRLGVRVRGRFAKRRELATLAVPVGSGAPGRFLIGKWARPWRAAVDPRGPLWLGTEWRATAVDPPKWRVWRTWWVRKHRYGRGAVMILGPSQSGKTTTAISASMLWEGPAIFSSVKADLVKHI